ncbi:MAG: flagellar motor protein [Methylophaga sp.]|jgi:chemotaxis protein MotA|uniref:flagellar motor protein n=1 Tax=unclassified Methylophaga TaxID=2629249 RepID=UPI000C9698D5|nr:MULTISPECIES: flagellar motor protein [unclassified Methylophaga]MAP26264.1 flagellar motor protein [Methylophaga sp.]MDX1748982.1 flagellar motor protein [Methylophaga sp.]HBX58877.1 flagellar motor protein [Methylophaga sp.]HCO00398.1 flagellar motor protein [Methylophaga sp.]|tara:strand:+ start:76695 stop:77435 length:741 start_codon:yes stop_codon:yes gene_type:complete
MDILSILGLLIGFGAIIVGQYLEGGHLDTILNAVALLIVLGGTLGAVMLQTPMNTFLRALKMTVWIFKPPQQSAKRLLEKILDWNQIARREGLLRLEAMAMEETDIFTQKGLQLIADGAEPEIIREILETDLDIMENNDLQAAKVYEAMGGYSPTIGIIGAVLGLIHVMGNLADPSSLGSGIAVAFVATIYGVGLANLLFLPMGNKLKTLVQRRTQLQMMLIDGLISVADGDNPRNIESRLQAYLG